MDVKNRTTYHIIFIKKICITLYLHVENISKPKIQFQNLKYSESCLEILHIFRIIQIDQVHWKSFSANFFILP